MSNDFPNQHTGPFSSHLLKRRAWLKMAGGAIPALSCSNLMAAERTGRWDDESIAEYTNYLIEWLRNDFARRAEQLKKHNGAEFPIKYDYLAPTDDRRKLRMLEKFEQGRLSNRDTEEHVTTAMQELEGIRASLAQAEAKAATEWKPGKVDQKETKGRIFDLDIVSTRMTVVLDSSHSMTPYLEKLRAEIGKDFQNAYIVEVNGCHLDRPASVPWFYAAPTDGVNPFTADRHIPRVPTFDENPHSRFISWTRSLPSAIDCMVDLMKTDLLYWFCDFDDDDHDYVIKQLGSKILENKVSLYVHTVDRRPPKLVSLLAERSGGAVIKKRI